MSSAGGPLGEWYRSPPLDEPAPFDEQTPCLMISVVARMVALHPQTIRQYERLGLLTPVRSKGNTRLFSQRDVARLRQILSLKERGVSLQGIEIICQLVGRLEGLEEELQRLRRELDR